MMSKQAIRIEKRTAFAVEIDVGTRFRIVQNEGPQVSVLVAFNKHDLSEYFSQGNTLTSLGVGPFMRKGSSGAMPFWVEKGDDLISNRWNRMLTLAEDTYGRHDIIFDPCDTFLNVNIMGQNDGYPGCRGLHADALEEWGMKYEDIPSGVNLFMSAVYSEEGIRVLPTNSKQGDLVAFQAHMDLLISATACPCPLGESRSVQLEIL